MNRLRTRDIEALAGSEVAWGDLEPLRAVLVRVVMAAEDLADAVEDFIADTAETPGIHEQVKPLIDAFFEYQELAPAGEAAGPDREEGRNG